MSSDQLKQTITPTVTLSGLDANGVLQNTTLSSKEATFVNGVFGPTPSTTGNLASVQKPIQTLVTASDEPFVVPGMNILIFPIGLIVTGAWTLIFVTAVGYGTIMRMRFRESYRRQSARVAKGEVATI